jgi:hypothetical protein
LGIAATLAANVADGLGHGVVGAAVAAWLAVALVGSYEFLMMIIRGSQVVGEVPAVPDVDPPQMEAVQVFANDLEADRIPSVRAIRGRLHVGHASAAGPPAPGYPQRATAEG